MARPVGTPHVSKIENTDREHFRLKGRCLPMELLPKELVARQLSLQFFDLDVVIKSDSSDFINIFGRMYRRFRVDEPPSTIRPPIEFVLIANPDNQWGRPVMIFDGEVWPLSNPEFLEGYAYESILSTVIPRIRSHLLIHAGVVSHHGQGIIIAADTRHGKTTLVLELVRRGFKFLSDEMAALGRVDHLVYPFPRSLWIRRGTLELAGFHDVADGAIKWMDKLLLDTEEIQPDSLGRPASLNHIIILQDPAKAQEAIQNNAAQEVCVMVDRSDDSLLAAIGQIGGVTDVRIDADCRFTMVRFNAIRSARVLSRIEALCRERRILILDVMKGARRHPTFKTPAGLGAIPKSQAVIELLGRFQGGYMSELLHTEFGGSSARLFMELSAIVGQANCYQLSVGPLHEMADLVCNLVGI